MDFGLSEEYQEIFSLAERMLGDQVTPESLQCFEDRKQPRFDAALWQSLADSGLLGIAIGTDNGGMGFSFNELCALYECCGKVLAPLPVLQSTVAALALQQNGVNDLLPSIAAGNCIISMSPQSNVARGAAQSNVTLEDGQLSGVLRFVPYFEQSQQLLVVAADVSGEQSLLLVDAADATITATEILVSSYEPQHNLQLKNTPATRIGGADAAQWFMDYFTVAICAFQLGAVDRMVKLTAEYTGQREQFGVKISTFQAVAHRAADCYIDATCLRLVTQQAASRLAEGLDAAAHIHSAKAWCGDAGHRISYATQHLHGGTGVDRSYPLWRYALWAKQNEIVMGNTGDHLRALGEEIALGAFEIDL